MGSHIFRIKFSKPSILLIDDYERLSENDKLKISSLEVLASFDYDEDEHYNCLMISDPLIIASYRKILEENLIGYECYDITNDVILHNIELNLNMIDYEKEKYDIFVDELENLIYENLDIDMILDRISKVGLNGLTDIEKQFLKDNESIS